MFDLDPGEGVAWATMQEGALLLRTLLQELGLQSWLKTTGGKGLHLFVPPEPAHGYDTVKAFSQRHGPGASGQPEARPVGGALEGEAAAQPGAAALGLDASAESLAT